MNKMGFHVNSIWFYAVALHILCSVLFGMLGNIGSILMNVVMLGLVFVVCRQRHTTIRQWCHVSPVPFGQWGHIFLLTVLCFMVAGYVNAISVLFTENVMVAAMAGVKYRFWESVIVYAVLPALVEELLFRGCIFRGIPDKRTAVIVSALLFALLHMNFNQMSYAFIMGIFFALMVTVTDNLTTSIVIHLLFNSINLVFVAFGDIPVISRLQRFCVLGYYPFAASFTDAEGTFYPFVFAVGTVVTLLAVGGIFAVLNHLNHPNRKKELLRQDDAQSLREEVVAYGDEEEPGREKKQPLLWVTEWRPDGAFWGGCVGCLIVAVAYEMLQ